MAPPPCELRQQRQFGDVTTRTKRSSRRCHRANQPREPSPRRAATTYNNGLPAPVRPLQNGTSVLGQALDNARRPTGCHAGDEADRRAGSRAGRWRLVLDVLIARSPWSWTASGCRWVDSKASEYDSRFNFSNSALALHRHQNVVEFGSSRTTQPKHVVVGAGEVNRLDDRRLIVDP